jgi:hypothetical protein
MLSAGVDNKVYGLKKLGAGFLENLAKEAAINLTKKLLENSQLINHYN